MRQLIEHGAHLLPAQGPITVFVHHNTLHAFENLPFDEAVLQGAQTYGCQPYLAEDRFREMLARGRIRDDDLREVLREDLGGGARQPILGLTDRLALRLRMLQYPLRTGTEAELQWLVAETDALRRFRADLPVSVRQAVLEQTRHWILRDVRPHATDDHAAHRSTGAGRARKALAQLFERFHPELMESWSPIIWEEVTLHALWRTCRQGLHGLPQDIVAVPRLLRNVEAPEDMSGGGNDLQADELLIRYCAAFLDQGLAGWTLPQRYQGFYRAFLALYRQAGGPPTRWMQILRQDLQRLERLEYGPLESIEESLRLLGLPEDQYEGHLCQVLFALRGWAGMIWQLETRGDRVPYPAPPGTLLEYVAIRLIVQRAVRVARVDERGDQTGRQPGMLPTHRHGGEESIGIDQRAFMVFQVAQMMGWTPENLFGLSRADWASLLAEIEDFGEVERRRIFHWAFERRYRAQALDALSVHAQRPPLRPVRPRLQVICCIDDREESFRRHLEEVAPDVETFGAAGFFGTAMYYRGAAEAHFTPLCPIVVRPQHWVVEDIALGFAEEHQRRLKTRRLVGAFSRHVHFSSRTLLGGALTALVGSLATIPLVAEVLFPRLTARWGRKFGQIMEPPAIRQLVLERTESEPAPEEGHFGFSVDEMAAIVERLLRDIGLTTNLARLLIVFGHGSSSANNPHESAYNCGACAGSRGGPNARAFAQMANDPRVRARLAQNGLELPAELFVVGAYHNTCDDSITYYDLERLPTRHRRDFQQARENVELARRRNAHERCRRFRSAPLNLSVDEALRHVEHRSENLAQTRPEYNHASNAMTFVGRRSRTRGLFLDRRTFLVSYDPTQDDFEQSLLTRILQPVIPVCAGISLEYYFSTVDPNGYGCNNKLPHNVTSLLGVMLGASSDLQPGLNSQMTEIHEPLRQLFVVESTPEAMRNIMERHPDIGRTFRNGWMQLATLDPQSATIHWFRDGEFEPYQPEATSLPQVGSSLEWYRGWRDHLGFAEIRAPAVSDSGGKAEAAHAGGNGEVTRPLIGRK